MSNVELFEICETLPKMQCSECLLHWKQGIVYCTCGHLMKQSEASQHFHQWQLDAFSTPHYVIRMVRPRGARHGKAEAQREHFVAHNARRRCLKKKFEGIHDRFPKESTYRNNVYNPISNNSKEKIRELGKFELCETIPKVQRSHSLLHWNQGVIYCTCGQFLVESESIQKFDKFRLDALSIPHYVIKKGVKLKHRNSTISPSTRGRDVAKELTLTIDFSETKYIVIRNSKFKIGWTEQKRIEMDKLAQEDHSYRLSRDEFQR